MNQREEHLNSVGALTASVRPIVWSIAGSDSGGGAGLQADLLTCHDLGAHGCSVVSAVTAQNSCAVWAVEAVSLPQFVAQIQALSADLPAAAIKIGLLPSASHLLALAEQLALLRAGPAQAPFVIYDPVAIASTGSAMAADDLLPSMEKLFPHLDLLTPNGDELHRLTGIAPSSAASLMAGVRQLLARGVRAVLVKGGHLSWQGDACLDYFSDGVRSFWLRTPRLTTRHGHGTGCCYASAIGALVAQQYETHDAITLARAYLQQGLAAAYPLGQGAGPIAHLGWPTELAHFPRVVLAGSPEAMALRLFSEAPISAAASYPTAPFAPSAAQLGLYPVVDSVAWLEKLLCWGVRTLQLRIKNPEQSDLEQQIAQAVALGRRYDARLFINDHWQAAIRHGAYGVHLGQEDLQSADLGAIQRADLRLGLSTHGYHEIARALPLQPSYLALGHIFPTRTKQMPSAPQGIHRLQAYVRLLAAYPTVAIGGIQGVRVAQVLATGVGSVALVTAITEAADPQEVTLALLAQMDPGVDESSAMRVLEVADV